MSMKATAVAVACATVVLFTGCAHVKTSDSRETSPQMRSISDMLSLSDDVKFTDVNTQGDIIVKGIKLENTKFDIPITINSRVEYWIDYFQGKGRPHFARYLERSELFIPFIQPILRQNKMPEDLVYLAMIESGFNNHARSRAKAVGPWQFVSATGKRYGLMVNWWVDERRDTRKSTMAAVGYLKDLYTMFGAWELAAAGYNAGEAKIARAIRRFGTKDFWVISRSRFLRPETRDYVPKIIAAAIISKNPTQFGFPASNIRPGAGETIAGDGEVVKLEKENEAQQPSPQAQADSLISVLKSDDYENLEDTPDDEELTTTTLSTLAENGAENAVDPSMPLAKPVPTPSVSKKGVVTGEELVEFEVQSPADILKVARAAGLSYATVKSLNPEVLRWCTPPNVSTYRLKLPASVRERFLTAYNHNAFPRKVQFATYKIRRGETLSHVARHFGIKVDPMTDLNGVSPRMPLRKGTRVLLPMPNDRSRTLASLEIRDAPESRHYRHHRSRRSGGKLYRVTYKRRAAARSHRRHRNTVAENDT